MNKRRTIMAVLVTGALAVVAAFGAFTYRAVYAQAATPTPSAPGGLAQPNQPEPGKGGPGGMRGGYSDQDLATALGITTDKLQAAYTTAKTEALKEAVSKGLITQAQADQMAANGFDQRHFDGFGIMGGANGIDYNALLAKALGITTDQFKTAQQQAINTNLDTAVKNGTMTQAQADEIKARNALAKDSKFQSTMKSAYEAAVKQAVTDGVITQAQADALLQSQSQSGSFFGPGPDAGFGHGFGGHGGRGFGGGPNNNQNSPAPTTTPSTNGL